METQLRITLFGHVTVTLPHQKEPLKLARSSQSLLAYLLLQPQPVAREVLMDVFWLDYPPERARSSLTTALWRLRQQLEPAEVPPGTYLRTSHTGEVGFNWASKHWLDLEWLDQQVAPLLGQPFAALEMAQVQRIKEVLSHVQGELLEGLYDNWAVSERERFRLRYIECLTRLMHFHMHHNHFIRSIALGHEILRRDPLREEIHRNLMRLYLASGQRTQALRQYGRCCTLLRQEMGIPPLPETEQLYQQILAAGSADSAAVSPAETPDLVQLAHELQRVKRSLNENTQVLTQIVHAMKCILGEAALGVTDGKHIRLNRPESRVGDHS